MYSYSDTSLTQDQNGFNVSSWNQAKRERYTPDFEHQMWRFLIGKLKIKDYPPARAPSGLQLWRDFITETKSGRTPQNLANHFRRIMKPNIMYSHLSNEDIAFLFVELKWDFDAKSESLFKQRLSLLRTSDCRGFVKANLINGSNGSAMETTLDQTVQGRKRSRASRTPVVNGSGPNNSQGLQSAANLVANNSRRKSRARPSRQAANDFLNQLVEQTAVNLDNNRNKFLVEDFETPINSENVISEMTLEVMNVLNRCVAGEDAKLDDEILEASKSTKGFCHLNDLVNCCAEFFKKQKLKSEEPRSLTTSPVGENNVEMGSGDAQESPNPFDQSELNGATESFDLSTTAVGLEHENEDAEEAVELHGED